MTHSFSNSHLPTLPQVTPWLTSLGYSLCYGTILVKMVRVWYIFNITNARRSMVREILQK